MHKKDCCFRRKRENVKLVWEISRKRIKSKSQRSGVIKKDVRAQIFFEKITKNSLGWEFVAVGVHICWTKKMVHEDTFPLLSYIAQSVLMTVVCSFFFLYYISIEKERERERKKGKWNATHLTDYYVHCLLRFLNDEIYDALIVAVVIFWNLKNCHLFQCWNVDFLILHDTPDFTLSTFKLISISFKIHTQASGCFWFSSCVWLAIVHKYSTFFFVCLVGLFFTIIHKIGFSTSLTELKKQRWNTCEWAENDKEDLIFLCVALLSS